MAFGDRDYGNDFAGHVPGVPGEGTTRVSRPGETDVRGPYGDMLTPEEEAMEMLLDMMYGEGEGGGSGGGDVGDTFNPEIEALRDMIDGVEDMAGARREGIRNVFGGAASNIEPIREGLGETFDRSSRNVDTIFDESQERLEGLSGGIDVPAGVEGVEGRIASAAAPFIAQGEANRASTQANLERHEQAGEGYFSRLGGAIQAESAQMQAQSDFAMQQQQFELQREMAALEGAQQRAIMETTADTAGSTQERMMRMLAFQALGAGENEAAALGVLGNEGMRALELMQGGDEGAGGVGEGGMDIDALLDIQRLEEGELDLMDARTGGMASRDRRLAAMNLGPADERAVEYTLQRMIDVGVDTSSETEVIEEAQRVLRDAGGEFNRSPEAAIEPSKVVQALLTRLGLS